MKELSRDITLTLCIKLVLLVLLWWFCVKGMHSVLSSNQEWLLGKEKIPKPSQIHKTR